MNRLESPKHKNARTLLRVGGPIILITGMIFVAVSLISFFSSMGTFEPPRYFWCGFVGMPLMFVGGVMCQFGYLGSVARYVAAESAPVAKDTFNYMADGTQEGIKKVARAVTEGIDEGRTNPKNPPPKN
jgi:hypothetical protein